MRIRLAIAVLTSGLTICPGWAAADSCEAALVHSKQAEIHTRDGKSLLAATIGLAIVTGIFLGAAAGSAADDSPGGLEQKLRTQQALSGFTVVFSTATSVSAIGTGVQFDLARSNDQLAQRFESNCRLTDDFEPRLPPGISLPVEGQDSRNWGRGMESEELDDGARQSPTVRDDATDPPSAAKRCDELRRELEGNVSRAGLQEDSGRRMVEEALKKNGCPVD
jgi:hypothetical protein